VRTTATQLRKNYSFLLRHSVLYIADFVVFL